MNKSNAVLFTALLVSSGGGSFAQTEPTTPPAKQSQEPVAVQTQTAPPQTQAAQVPLEEPKKHKKYVPRLGFDLGYIRVMSSRTRNVFGNGGGFNYGPGFGTISSAKRGSLSISPDFDLFNASRKINGQKNSIFMISAGVAFRYMIPFGPGGPPEGEGDGPGGDGPGGEGPGGGGPPGGIFSFLALLSPYVEFGAGLTYADISARSEGISGKRYSYSGSLAVGTGIGDRAFLQLRYRALPRILSFDTSSLSFEGGIRF